MIPVFKPLIEKEEFEAANTVLTKGYWYNWEQLISYTILTYSMLGSIDLTHVILAHVDEVYNSSFSKKFLNILLTSNEKPSN